MWKTDVSTIFLLIVPLEGRFSRNFSSDGGDVRMISFVVILDLAIGPNIYSLRGGLTFRWFLAISFPPFEVFG